MSYSQTNKKNATKYMDYRFIGLQIQSFYMLHVYNKSYSFTKVSGLEWKLAHRYLDSIYLINKLQVNLNMKPRIY